MTSSSPRLLALREELLDSNSYIAANSFTPTVGWTRQGYADILVDKRSAEIKTVAIVGRVADYRLFCGPLGNYVPNNSFNTKLESARFNLFLQRPDTNSGFFEDFGTALNVGNTVQETICRTGDIKHWMEGSGVDVMLKFGAPLFEKREQNLNLNARASWSMQDETEYKEYENYPVPERSATEFAALSLSHKLAPLPVFDENGIYIEPANVNAALCNSLVEIHFNLKHFAIRERDELSSDTMTAIIRQIVILQRNEPPRTVIRGTQDLRRGPISLIKGKEKEGVVTTAGLLEDGQMSNAVASGSTVAGSSKRPGDDVTNERVVRRPRKN